MFHLQSTRLEVVVFFVAVIAIGSLASRGERKTTLGFLFSLSVVLVLPVLAFYFLFANSNGNLSRLRFSGPGGQTVTASATSAETRTPSFTPQPGGLIVRSSGRVIRTSQDSEARKGRVSVTIKDGRVEGGVETVVATASTENGISATAEATPPVPPVPPHGDGEMLVLPLNEALLKEMLGAEAVAAIEALNESVAPELRQAYAMIPISGPRVTPLQQIMNGPAPRSIGVLSSAFSGLMSEPLAEAPTETIAEAVAAETLPEWVNEPLDGHMTVTSEFTDDLDADPLKLLEPQLEEAIGRKYYELLSETVGADSHWDRLMQVKVSDKALKASVSDLSTEVTNVSEAYQQDVVRAHALVRIPTKLSPGMLKTAESAVRLNRVLAVCTAAGLIWLAAFLASLLMRSASGKSMLKKAVVAPALGLAMIPCLGFAAFVVKGMSDGENFHEWTDGPIVCVVDELE